MTKINNQKINFKFESNNAFKERLKKIKKATNIVNFKQKEKVKPIFSTNCKELNFTNQGSFGLATLKKSFVVDFNNQLITTKKRVTVVKPTSLKKAKEKLASKTQILKSGVVIQSKVNKFIVKNKEKLNDLQEQLEQLNKSLSNVYNKEEIADKKNKMLNIKKQTEMIKLQCLLISYNSDFENFALSKDETLLKNIDFFVHQASNQDIKFLAKSLKKDLDYLDNLFVLLDKTLYLDYKINDKENEIIKRNSDFKEYQEDVLELKMSEESLNNEVNNQVVESEKILKKIEEFDNSNQSLSINELRIIADDYLNYILNGDFLIKILHFLTLNVFKNDKKEAIKQIKNRQRLIEMIYSDYEYELSKEIDNLKKLSNNIKKSINQLSWLKMVFDNKFYKYKDVLPEYKIIYEKLANLDKQLLKSKESVDLLENNLNIEKSKVKVKKFS